MILEFQKIDSVELCPIASKLWIQIIPDWKRCVQLQDTVWSFEYGKIHFFKKTQKEDINQVLFFKI